MDSVLAELSDPIRTKSAIDELQRKMSLMPQAEMLTEHFFVPGMYCRKVTRGAGTLIVGKVHKQPHFFVCASGEIAVWSENGTRILKAGDVVESTPGTKRVTLALTDAVGMTVHKTDKTELDDIEDELIEPDESAMFDAKNELRQAVIEGVAMDKIEVAS